MTHWALVLVFIKNILSFISEINTEESLPDKSHNESLPIQESCGTEQPTDDKSTQGDPGGKNIEQETTNNQGIYFISLKPLYTE